MHKSGRTTLIKSMLAAMSVHTAIGGDADMGLQSPNQAYACKVSDVLEDNRSPDLGFVITALTLAYIYSHLD
jgi:hypothetical protein